MTVITRTITNNLSTNLELFVPGYNTIKPQISIAPSATLDLFTVITGDELEALQNQLTALVAKGSITVNATVNTNTFNPVGGFTPTPPAGINAEVQFNSSGSFGADATFLWDSTNHRLGIGGSLPAYDLDVTKTTASTGSVIGSVINGRNNGDAVWQAGNNSLHFIEFGIGGSTFGGLLQDRGFVYTSNSLGIAIVADSAGTLSLNTAGPDTAHTRLFITNTGNIGINTITPNVSALIDMESTTQGFLPPQMTTTQKDAISTPASGLVVYDTTLNKLSVWTGSAWETVTSS